MKKQKSEITKGGNEEGKSERTKDIA